MIRLGFAFLIVGAAALLLQIASGIPIRAEVGPLSIAQAVFLGLLSVPCAALSLQLEEEAKARILWGMASAVLVTISLVQLGASLAEALPERSVFEYPAFTAWGAAAAALLLMQRLGRPFGRGRAFVLSGFALQSVAMIADFADGGGLGLTPASLRLLGSADELIELLVLANYLVGLTLVAEDILAGTLRGSSGPEPRSMREAFSPSRAYVGRWLSERDSAATRSSATFLHAAYRHIRWRSECFSRQERALLLFRIVFWPLIVFLTSSRYTLANGQAIRHRSGKGMIDQVGEQLLLAFGHSIAPRAYYMFELYLDAQRCRVGSFLQRFETKHGIYPLIKRGSSVGAGRTARAPLNDKGEFIDWCRRHSIPVVPYVLVLEKGAITRSSTADGMLPTSDLFAKPNKGKGGKGAEVWSWKGDGTYAGSSGDVLTTDALLARFRDLSLTTNLLVQPAVRNHRLLADLNLGALTTVRIVTCRNEAGAIEATNAAMRVARGTGAVVDNFHAGGLAAKVDVESGVLGRATDLGVHPAIGWRSRHPANGAPIAGRGLARWPEALDVVRRAHEAFSDRMFVGWDIALLDGGWQVVEGNGSPDLDIIQRTHQEPLGDARLGQLLAFHTAEALSAALGPGQDAAASLPTAAEH